MKEKSAREVSFVELVVYRKEARETLRPLPL